MPRLTDEALELLRDTAETARAVGDPETATALELLLQWYEEWANVGDLPEGRTP